MVFVPDAVSLQITFIVDRQIVLFKDLGSMEYQQAWDYQEELLQENVRIKSAIRDRREKAELDESAVGSTNELITTNLLKAHTATSSVSTTHHLLFVEHAPVYTLGKSGDITNVLLNEEEREAKGIQFFKTNRGGDITYHGPGQIVGYPILDLEKFYTDIGKYLRNIEQVIIATLGDYGLQGDRSRGETGVWLDPHVPGRERKICAIGVRCSRWITMHGFAFNVNPDLNYFNHIIPCGIQNKQVTSLEKELGRKMDMEEVKETVKKNFSKVFGVELVNG